MRIAMQPRQESSGEAEIHLDWLVAGQALIQTHTAPCTSAGIHWLTIESLCAVSIGVIGGIFAVLAIALCGKALLQGGVGDAPTPMPVVAQNAPLKVLSKEHPNEQDLAHQEQNMQLSQHYNVLAGSTRRICL